MHPLYILIGVWLQGFQRDCCKSFKTVTQKIVLIRCVVVPVYMLQPWSAEAWYAHFNSCLVGSMLNDTISGSATLQCHDQKSWSMSQRHDPQPLSSSNVRIALIDSLWRLILSKLLCCCSLGEVLDFLNPRTDDALVKCHDLRLVHLWANVTNKC